MAESAQDKKILFIPGWLDVVNRYGYKNGLDIWLSKSFPKTEEGSNYWVGHSLGANFALLNWNADSDVKLILINPLLVKRSKIKWMAKWLKSTVLEKDKYSLKRIATLKYFFSNLKKAFFLLEQDYTVLLDKIPADKIVIIRGKKDSFYCDQETADLVRQKNIQIIEIEGVGHNWVNDRFNKVVEGLIA